MSQNPLSERASKSDSTTENIDRRDRTSINNVDIKESDLPPHWNEELAPCLFHDSYANDHLWDPHRGLLTLGQVAGIALDDDFPRKVLEKHLSYPVYAKPWNCSPFISVYINPAAVNRGARPYSNPDVILEINVKEIFKRCAKPYIFSLRRLVEHYKMDPKTYESRPFWEFEYLIFDYVPSRAIRAIDPRDFRNKCKSL